MNAKKIVALSNIIGIVSIFLLIYWVFIFVSMEVFGLKIFRENMTQTFYLSIFGILALMFGALILNIMFNLTRIAEKHNNDEHIEKKTPKALAICIIISFPLIFGLLVGGDLLTSIKKEKMLISSAKSIVDDNLLNTKLLTDYKFDKIWIKKTSNILKLMSKTDNNYNSASIIIKDQIGESSVFLQFSANYYDGDKDVLPNKVDFVFKTSKEERKYLHRVFDENHNKELFSAYDGKYKLFYPIIIDGKIIVLYFSDSQDYGKLGS